MNHIQNLRLDVTGYVVEVVHEYKHSYSLDLKVLRESALRARDYALSFRHRGFVKIQQEANLLMNLAKPKREHRPCRYVRPRADQGPEYVVEDEQEDPLW